MLTRVVAAFATAALMVMLPAGVPSAFAANDGTCGWETNPVTYEVTWVCAGGETDPGGDAGGGGAESGGSSICRIDGEEIPCTGPEGSVWNGNCYVAAPLPEQPNAGPNGEEIPAEGQYHVCFLAPGIQGPDTIWVAVATPPVDPEQVAYQAITAMDLDPIAVGIVPESGPDRMGLVGLPTWMWVDNPQTENAWGPITRSASDGPVTVSATAKVAEVIWDMGDGSAPISCGAGTPYTDSYGKTASPTCGHRYELMSDDEPGGAYQVTATSHWVIDWSGGGLNGTIELDTSSDAMPIRIGEAQVLTQ